MSMPSYNASMYVSETETLLPHSPPSSRFFSSSGQYTDNDHDHPVQIDSFLHNVKVCKSALGASLLGTFVMEIWHLSMSVAEVGHWRHSGTQHKAIEATMWADILGTTIIVSVFGISLCHCICWGILMSVFEFVSASYRSSTSHHS